MSTVKTLTEEEALKYVLDSLHRHSINETYPQLQSNFPDFEPSNLFRTLVLQQCWVDICNENLNNAIIHIQELGESPGQIFHEMWKKTTRTKARQILYDYLHKQSLLSPTDEENYSILLKLINLTRQETPHPKKQKSFFSFSQKSKQDTQPKDDTISKNQADIMNAFTETIKSLTEDDKTHGFEVNSPLTDSYNENKTMIFPDLFNKLLPKESNSNFFIGNINLIESQPPKILRYLKTNEGSTVERLWVLHCEQRIDEMQKIFTDDITKFKSENFDSKPKKLFQFQHQPNENAGYTGQPAKRKKPKCLKFCDLYASQLNEYEKESLFDILAVNGYFCECEHDSTDKLLHRICKNKLLFDQNWWNKTTTLNFEKFFKNFSKFCSLHNLFLPFEIFVINNPRTKEIDLASDPEMDEHPLIRFIWNLWVKREPFSASVCNFQFISQTNKNEANFEELWKDLPDDSLAPLSLFVWNKDPTKFLKNSPESILLSNRLKKCYPLLAQLVNGETPHPQNDAEEVKIPPNQKKWRFQLFTSKYDLELHDTIESHFERFEFDKVFSNYYGEVNFPGQPPYPHFDHPELISSPSDPPYFYYVKSLLPISAFQTAVCDKIPQEQFVELCSLCMREALVNKSTRLAALTFIELTDFKFGTDLSVDFKICLSVFDLLTKAPDKTAFDVSSLLSIEAVNYFSFAGSSITTLAGSDVGNSSAFVDLISGELTKVFKSKSQDAARFLQQKLHPTNIDVLLLSLLLGIRCGLPPDYDVITLMASEMHPAELVLFLDRAEEIGCKYDMSKVASIVRDMMPQCSLKDPILFLLTQELPSIYESSKETNDSNEEEDTIDMEMEPALVVFRALNRKKDSPCVSLLREAALRRDSFYSIIASMTDGADQSMCALVTLSTMTDAFSFDVRNAPDKETRSRLFLEVISSLLLDGKSSDVLKSIEIFSKESIVIPIVTFYDSVFIFAFRRAQLSIARFFTLIKKSEKKIIEDDLIGEIQVDEVLDSLFPLQEALAKHCCAKSQIHLFRYLQLLNEIDNFGPKNLISPFLVQRVKLAVAIEKHEDFRRSLLHVNLIGDKEKIVHDLITHHSLRLGKEAAECLAIEPSAALNQWLSAQYLEATTVEDVLKIHSRIESSIEREDEDDNDEEVFVDPLFFVSLFAELLLYERPSRIVHVIELAEKLLARSHSSSNVKGKECFMANVSALIMHLRICSEQRIDSSILFTGSHGGEKPSKETVSEVIQILFPLKGNNSDYNDFVRSIPTDISFDITSPVTFSVDTIRSFFLVSIEKVVEFCLAEKGLNEAQAMAEWQNRNLPIITSLDTVKMLFKVYNSKRSKVVHIIDDDDDDSEPTMCFTSKQKDLIVDNGMKSSNFKEKSFDSYFLDTIEAKDLQDVLDSLASKHSQIFKIISLHFQASTSLFTYSESDQEFKKKSQDLIHPTLLLGKKATERTLDFLRSPLPMMVSKIELTRSLIDYESLSADEVSEILSANFIQMLLSQKTKEMNNSNVAFVLVDDYSERFVEFAKLSKDITLFGDKLLSFADRQIRKKEKSIQNELKMPILSNVLLHASLCTTRIEECSKLFDSLYEKVFSEKEKTFNQNSEVYKYVMKIITKFPEPSLLPRFISFVVAVSEDDMNSIQSVLNSKLGLEILNEASQLKSFNPENFFNLTLACKLYREHAVLQMECANRLLNKIIIKDSDDQIDLESESISSSENLTSDSGNDLIPLDRKEQRKLKKLEKQKQKEERIELKKLKKEEKKKEKELKKLNKKEILQESSRHFLLALAYSLHEKCYNMSMECLKKLSLISLQNELSYSNSSNMSSSSNLIQFANDRNLNVFGLNENEVLMLMKTREFPFALTIAISYDMDNEINWSKSLFAQSIEKQGEDFLAAFVYFKPMTKNLWEGVVERYREYFDVKERVSPSQDKDVRERMMHFLQKIPNLVERYRLYKKLNFEKLVEDMEEKHPVICEWCDKVF